MAQFTVGEWFVVAQYELLLFAAVFFALGALDEFAVDCAYFWLRLTGRAKTPVMDETAFPDRSLAGRAAVFIPAWRESAVIGPTLSHALAVWRHDLLRIYVGCYANDSATIASVVAAARDDGRVRLVIHGAEGPTSKADCLNRLYTALCEDESRAGERTRMVVLHDAEDMVDPAALALIDHAMFRADFVQLPVLALPQSGSRWVAGHYSDEFAEAHGKVMVVRDALGAGLPGAGVGCAIARTMLEKLARASDEDEPFSRASLTEDYELGLRIAKLGGSARFLRVRTGEGRLIATRAYFPSKLEAAVRQKTRWTHGIALQSWDRLGWSGGGAALWMTLRDRKGPFAALLLAIAYLLVIATVGGWIAEKIGVIEPPPLQAALIVLLGINFFFFFWRAAMRALFTAREFGWVEGLRAIPRTVVSNYIAILSGRRALWAYVRSLRGAPFVWDKTEHHDHPAFAAHRGPAK